MGSRLSITPFPREADSSDDLEMAGTQVGGNLQGNEWPGGLSREKGYGLFMPTICNYIVNNLIINIDETYSINGIRKNEKI